MRAVDSTGQSYRSHAVQVAARILAREDSRIFVRHLDDHRGRAVACIYSTAEALLAVVSISE